MQESKRIRVLLAEDHAIVREGLRSLLEKQPEIEIVCDAEDGRIAVERVRELQPDVVIMDITLAGEMDGIEAASIIKERFGIPVIYLTASTDNTTMAQAKTTEPFAYIIKPYEKR